jgi:death-on-curing protein
MAASSRRLDFPTFEEIVRTNRRLIERYGGIFLEPDNIKEQGKLEWVLEVIEHPLSSGEHLYPTIIDKAAILFWKITAEHTFWDGGKRTGLMVATSFLQKNRMPLNRFFQEEAFDVAVRLADAKVQGYTMDDLTKWLRRVTRNPFGFKSEW